MTRLELVQQIFEKKTYLCVGLDTDPRKLPTHLANEPDGVVRFNQSVIDATKNFCVAYKINTAFYEAQGVKGWEIMQQTADYIPSTHLKIADAKRGDIGNTSAQYAKAFFETMRFDAVTVAPYMGEDSVRPFLDHKDKWTIVLGLTSNAGANDFEMQKIVSPTTAGIESGELTPDVASAAGERLYETVLRKVSGWGNVNNLMFVVGATKPAEFVAIRQIIPAHFFLVPGIGVQGGSLQAVSEQAMTEDCGLLVNASRAVIYASAGEDFADAAGIIAKEYALEMAIYLKQKFS